MARIGGRNLWLAWPAGLLCAAVVGSLAWLAAPAVPGTIRFVGDTLREATWASEEAAAQPVARTALDGSAPIDCRDLYPAPLWGELAWTPQVLLDQSHGAPATTVTALVDALQPAVAVTCTWRGMAGTIVSTLSVVSPEAAAIADLALSGQGFSCAPFGSGVTCRRAAGAVVEEQTVRDGLWLASVETAWHPEVYGARLAAFVWS